MSEHLLAQIAAWRADDKQGYDTAIELLCDAEDELTLLQAKFDVAIDALTDAAFAYEDEELIKLCDELDPIDGPRRPPSDDAVDPHADSTGKLSTRASASSSSSEFVDLGLTEKGRQP